VVGASNWVVGIRPLLKPGVMNLVRMLTWQNNPKMVKRMSKLELRKSQQELRKTRQAQKMV